MDEWDWHRVLDVNLTGAFLMTQSVGRVMRDQGSGVIINLLTRNQETAEEEAAFVTTMQGLGRFHQSGRARTEIPLGSKSTQLKPVKMLSKASLRYWRKNEGVEGVSCKSDREADLDGQGVPRSLPRRERSVRTAG
jgi:NAD(P)-dependent dehydrogenase (short-subunit alcohol dehydrogenase family)